MSSQSKKILSFFLSLLVTLLVVELGLFFFYSIKEKHFVSAASLFKKNYHFDVLGTKKCSWGASTSLHPYWGFSYHKEKNCAEPERNNYGLKGRDFSFEKQEQFYTVLFFGGSVAEGIATYKDDKQNFIFEDLLNKTWQSPNGKPFRVLNAAIAGGQMPISFIQAGMFYPLADVALSLEGYNEHYALNKGEVFETPGILWQDHALAESHPFLAFIYKNTVRGVRSANLLKHSYLYYFSALTLTQRLQNYWLWLAKLNSPLPDLPNDWSAGQKKSLYLRSYQKYLSLFHSIFKQNNIPSLTFIQPAPRYNKVLTSEEETNVGTFFDNGAYGEVSQFMDDLPQDEVPHESLMEIFKDHKETLYVDHIHTNSVGTLLLVQELSERLGRRFHWKKKGGGK